MIADGRHDDGLAAYGRCRCDTCREDRALAQRSRKPPPPASSGAVMRGDSMGEVPAFRLDPRRACRGVDPEIFFPTRGEAISEAVALCLGCPVLIECRRWGIEHEQHGVWGGTSERERRRLRRTLGIRLVSIEPTFVDPIDTDPGDAA